MARFLVKASEFKNVCKAVNDSKLTELKKEIIEILKKQDEKEVKKAIDYFNSQELHYTHLEKSFTGKWVEKAGYGIGTVRIWKGKKYKKIAPGKWARVFDKEGRGTNIAIGKLIAKVQKIDNVEDLMAFVMANKQRFVDENGMDLPVLDKLRAAVDAKNSGDMGSKGTSKPAEKKKTFKQEMNQLYDAQDEAWEGFESGSDIKLSPENSKKFYERVKKFVDDNNIKLSQKHYDEIEENNGHSFNEALELAGAYGEEKKEKAIAKNKEYSKKYKGQILDLAMIDEFKTEEKPAEKKSAEEHLKDFGFKPMEKVSFNGDKWEVAGVVLDYNGNADGISLTPDRQAGNLQSSNVTVLDIEKIKKEEKTSEKETPKSKRSNVKVFADKSSVGTFTKVDENNVEMPATKETMALFDSLKKSVSKDDTRPFMTDCYYDGENIISTDGRRLVCIKAGNIGLDEGFVKVKTDGGKIKLEKFEKDFGDFRVKEFPNYKRVMPENNTQEVQLNQKVLKEKLKTMKKEGAWDSKKNFRIALEFVDGKVMLDGTQVGTADGVKFDSDEQNININAEYLADALGNEDSVSMFVSDNPTKAFSLSDNVSDIVIMPMHGDENSVPDYEARRAEKAGAKAEKEKKERDYKVANKKRIEDSMSRTNVDELVDKRASEVDEWLKKDDEFLERTYEQMNYNLDKDLGRKEFLSVGDKVGKGRKFTVMSVYMHNKLAEKHPEVKEKLEAELEKRGISVKKSLFDGFLLESLLEDEEDFDDEDETEYNDYSAEQPELFNSTEFKVREALNRRFNCVM